MSSLIPLTRPRIDNPVNPYRDNVQAKANEPITVAALLDRGKQVLGLPGLGWSLDEIYDRMEANAPRVAIIGGSPDHPAHILDLETSLRAAHRIWQQGGVPFSFSVPVLCDGTAQSTMVATETSISGPFYPSPARPARTSIKMSPMFRFRAAQDRRHRGARS